VIPAVHIGGVRVTVHPGLLALLGLALYARLAPEALVYAAVLLGHELAHVLAAAAFGLRVSALELLPTGGVARVEGLELADPGAEAAVAVAGPMHNLLCLAAGFVLREAGWLAPGRGAFFLAANAALALGNLIPALPLDGGRVVRAALAVHRGTAAATLWVSRAGVGVGAALCLAGAALALRGVVAPGLFVFGAFTLVRARPAQEGVGMRPWREMAARAARLRALPVHHLAAAPALPLRTLVSGFLPRHYHLVWLVDAGGSARGPWDEADIWRACVDHGADARAEVLGTRV
jgi:stage IV sporulation protein FB